MSLAKKDYDRLWEALGKIHVVVDDVRFITRLARITEAGGEKLSINEEHLLNIIESHMAQIDATGNQASKFVKDFMEGHG